MPPALGQTSKCMSEHVGTCHYYLGVLAVRGPGIWAAGMFWGWCTCNIPSMSSWMSSVWFIWRMASPTRNTISRPWRGRSTVITEDSSFERRKKKKVFSFFFILKGDGGFTVCYNRSQGSKNATHSHFKMWNGVLAWWGGAALQARWIHSSVPHPAGVSYDEQWGTYLLAGDSLWMSMFFFCVAYQDKFLSGQ